MATRKKKNETETFTLWLDCMRFMAMEMVSGVENVMKLGNRVEEREVCENLWVKPQDKLKNEIDHLN